MWKYFLCLMSMLLTLTAWGCSLAPQPVARPVTGQQTLEAVDHWRILAQQIVKEMQLTTGSSVYVSEQDRSPFGRAFTTLLRHEVAASGARLSGCLLYTSRSLSRPLSGTMRDRPTRCGKGCAQPKGSSLKHYLRNREEWTNALGRAMPACWKRWKNSLLTYVKY